jgi:hypothetical protein
MKHLKLFETFTNNIVIGIDIDGTINNMVDAYNDMYSKYFPNNKVFKADMWDWYQQMEYGDSDAKQWFNSHKAEVFDTCQPYPGAVYTIGKIYDFVKSLGYTLNIVTNQPTPEAKVAAKKWLDKNGFKYDDVNFADPSSAKWNYADIMVDDGLKVLKSKPADKVTIKIMQLWNKDLNSNFEISSINSLTPELLQKAIDQYETFKSI